MTKSLGFSRTKLSMQENLDAILPAIIDAYSIAFIKKATLFLRLLF
jgi:hypothetical protein